MGVEQGTRERELAQRYGVKPPWSTVIQPEIRATFLRHPVHQWAQTEITNLLMMLRTLDDAGQYYNFQRWLWSDVVRIEHQLDEASKHLARVLRGKRVPEAPEGNWWSERMVLRDVARQLRSVGDGLAWQLFGFDRRYVIALSRNQMTGPIHSKAGHRQELQTLMDLWQKERAFALINDLTNNVRTGDLTVFRPGVAPEIKEVKTGGKRIRKEQRDRINRALATLHAGAPMPRGIALLASPIKLDTHMESLYESFTRSSKFKVDATAVEPGWALVTTVGGASTLDEAQGLLSDALTKATKLAQFGNEEQYLSFNSDDHLGMDPSIAPFSIYPLPPVICAALLGTRISYRGALSARALAVAFDQYGFKVSIPQPAKTSDREMGERTFIIQKGDRSWNLMKRGLGQVILELVTVNAYVRAVVNAIENHPSEPLVGLTFSDEHETWGKRAWD